MSVERVIRKNAWQSLVFEASESSDLKILLITLFWLHLCINLKHNVPYQIYRTLFHIKSNCKATESLCSNDEKECLSFGLISSKGSQKNKEIGRA